MIIFRIQTGTFTLEYGVDMLKKIVIIFFAVTSVLQATAQFDPEDADFSKMDTIKTWVDDIHHKDPEQMLKIQRFVAEEVPQNPEFRKITMYVKNNPGDHRSFGMSFEAIAAIQLPFLQFVHKRSLSKPPVVLEIAAGNGRVSSKVPYTFKDGKGLIYVNDLSEVMLSKFDNVIDDVLTDKLRKTIRKVPGDCFNILKDHPELEGNVDAVYVQNYEHYLPPEQHQQLVKSFASLLAPGGQVFSTAHTIWSDNVENNDPVYKTYAKYKNTHDYPGFIESVSTILMKPNRGLVGAPKFISAERPSSDSITCFGEVLQERPMIVITPNGPRKGIEITQRWVNNFLTPTIYKTSIEPHESLHVVDRFFIDKMGTRHDKFSSSPCIKNAAAIIRKQNHSDETDD